MRNRVIFLLSLLGMVIALVSAYFFSIEPKAQPPAFNPAANPYANGIYANGIVESAQSSGSNINIYPEVAGVITQILVREGQHVQAGTPLALIDDSVQRATVGQQKAQAEAALALLQELKAQPRKETLAVSKAQLDLAAANLRTSRDQYVKQKRSYDLEPRSVSRDALDNAYNTLKTAEANYEVAQKQYILTKAGAWIYDIENQQRQYDALVKAYESGSALLEKYTLKAPVQGLVLALNVATGSYVSGQGVYDTYTQGADPLIVMGKPQDYLNVRCFIDEILIHRIPSQEHITAQMFIRGTNIRIPLEFVRIQPYVSPKIQLSNQRQERVDVRVLPVIFRFPRQESLKIYPGQLVDVYVGQK